MKHVLNVIRFLIYIPLSLFLLLLLYWCIGLCVGWLADRGLFMIILLGFFLSGVITYGMSFIFLWLAGFVSYINPYKQLGGWIVIPIAVIFGILAIYNVWTVLDLNVTKHLVISLLATGLIFYTTIAFCTTISIKNLKTLSE